MESLRNPIVKRGIAYVLKGIGYYGVQRSQTTACSISRNLEFHKTMQFEIKHCYENAEQKPASDELTTEEAKKAIDDFESAGVIPPFSGEEPLTRKDFFEVAKYAADKEFYVSIASNGTLITKITAQKMKGSGIQYIKISLNVLKLI
jgi:MoaA/NifB/PqqE/SkfB family radical SAM enzyme